MKTGAALLFAILLVGLAAASMWGLFDSYSSALGLDGIDEQNRRYLHAAREDVDRDAVALAEILAILSVVGSIEIGFTFLADAHVTIGRTISSLILTIEQALLTSVFAGAVVEVLLLLTSLARRLAAPLFSAALVSVAIYVLLSMTPARRATEVSRAFCQTVVSLFFVAHLLVPYSIQVSGWAASSMLATASQDHRENIENFSDETRVALGHVTEVSAWKAADEMASALEAATSDAGQKSHVVRRYHVWRIAHSTVFGVAVPILSFLLLWWAGRRLVVLI